MRHLTLDVIQEEHQALAAMLRSMTMLLVQSRRESSMPPFDVLRAMLFYVDEFPERLHHKKESELLFPMLRRRAPQIGAVLDQLDRDHASGEKSIRDLEHALLAFDVMGEPRRAIFEKALEDYVRFYLEHMAKEEAEVLPVARAALTNEDWAELDAAFAANRDPLLGHEPEEGYRPLFKKILMTTPAPIGLGPER